MSTLKDRTSSILHRCSECRQNKPRSDFRKRSNRPIGVYNVCRQCDSRLCAERRVARATLGKAAPGYACPVCDGMTPRGGWVADHDHATGKPRALLCRSCNLTISEAERGTAHLDQRAVLYLAAYRLQHAHGR